MGANTAASQYHTCWAELTSRRDNNNNITRQQSLNIGKVSLFLDYFHGFRNSLFHKRMRAFTQAHHQRNISTEMEN